MKTNIPTRQLPLGAGHGAPLPYDSLVEYVESTGAQYVDTGIYADPTTRVVADMEFTDASFTQTVGTKSTRNSGGGSFAMRLRAGVTWLLLSYGVNGAQCDTLRHTFRLNGSGKSYVDAYGSNAKTSYAIDPVNQTLCWFAYRGSGSTIESWARLRLYSMSISESDSLVRDLVPCRVGSAGALYDRVSGTLYYSATSTPLIPGHDLP